MRKLLFALVAVLGLSTTSAFAGFVGESLRLDYFYPTLGTSLSNTTVVVPVSGVTYTCCVSTEFTPSGSVLSISIADSSIVITGGRSQVFSSATFNGLSFFDVSFGVDPISDVSLVSSDLPGVDASDISFDADRVNVNFADANGLNLESWRVELAMQFNGNQVPEPTSMALVGLALAGMGFVGARRRSHRV